MQSMDASTQLKDGGSYWTFRSARDGGYCWTSRSADTDVSTQPGTPRTESVCSVCSDEEGSFSSTDLVPIADFLDLQTTSLENDSTASKVYCGLVCGDTCTDLCLADEDRLSDASLITEMQNTILESESPTAKIIRGLICGDTGMDLFFLDGDHVADASAIFPCVIEDQPEKTLKSLILTLLSYWSYIFSESTVEALGSANSPQCNAHSNSLSRSSCDIRAGSPRICAARHVLCDGNGVPEKCSQRVRNRKMQGNAINSQSKLGLRSIQEDGTFHSTFSTCHSNSHKMLPPGHTEEPPARLPRVLQCVEYLLDVHPTSQVGTVSGWECVAASGCS
jgi:hypothetical protein